MAKGERWTHEAVNRLGADKGFLPEEYWPEEYVWVGNEIHPPAMLSEGKSDD